MAPVTTAEKASPPAASASAASSAAASAAPGDDGAPTDRTPEVPFKGETPASGKKVTTKRAWGYWPDYMGVGVYDVKESTDAKTTFLEFASTSATFTIPSAFTHPAVAPKLKKGDLVLATVVTNGVCAVVKEIKDDKVNVGFLWGQKPDTRDFAKEDLLRFNDKLEFGTRVLRKEGEDWRLGVLVHADKANAWVIGVDPGQEDVKVPLADVRVLDITKRRKKGEKVLACTFETLGCIETTIVGQKHDGLAYDIALPEDFAGHAPEGAKSLEASACSVGSVPKK